MSAFTNITLNTKVYTPTSYKGEMATWTNRDGGVAAAFSPLTQRFYQAPSQGGKAGAFHSVHRLTVPIVAAVDTECSCAGSLLRESGLEVRAWFAPASTTAERTDLLARLRALVLDPAFEDSFTALSPVY